MDYRIVSTPHWKELHICTILLLLRYLRFPKPDAFLHLYTLYVSLHCVEAKQDQWPDITGESLWESPPPHSRHPDATTSTTGSSSTGKPSLPNQVCVGGGGVWYACTVLNDLSNTLQKAYQVKALSKMRSMMLVSAS